MVCGLVLKMVHSAQDAISGLPLVFAGALPSSHVIEKASIMRENVSAHVAWSLRT